MTQRSNDPQFREKLARAFFRVGEITQVVGPARDALSAFQSAVEIWEPLVAADPDNLEFKARLADSYVAISRLKQIDSLQEALNWLQLARQIREDLTFHKPSMRRSRRVSRNVTRRSGIATPRSTRPPKPLEFLQMARPSGKPGRQISQPDRLQEEPGGDHQPHRVRQLSKEGLLRGTADLSRVSEVILGDARASKQRAQAARSSELARL